MAEDHGYTDLSGAFGEDPTPETTQADGGDDLISELTNYKNKLGLGDLNSIGRSEDDTADWQNDITDLNDHKTGYQNFTKALQNNPEEALGMLEQWSPLVAEQLKETIYRKHVASGEWLQRAAQEYSGDPQARVAALERQNAALAQQLQSIGQAQTKAQQERTVNNYVNEVERLSDAVNLSKAERDKVFEGVTSAVQADPRLKAAILRGDFTAVRNVFRDTTTKVKLGDEIDIDTVSGKDSAKLSTWVDQQLHALLQKKNAGRK